MYIQTVERVAVGAQGLELAVCVLNVQIVLKNADGIRQVLRFFDHRFRGIKHDTRLIAHGRQRINLGAGFAVQEHHVKRPTCGHCGIVCWNKRIGYEKQTG